MSEDTIERWCKRTYKETFAVVFSKKRSKGKISIRRAQMKAAQRGNPSILIWMGKQYLGQREIPEEESSDCYEDNFLDALNKSAADIWKEDIRDGEKKED